MTPDSPLPARRALPSREVGDELMVRSPDSGEVHFLNGTAAIIYACCDGATTAAQCEQLLRARFVIPDDVDLQADIRATVRDLQEKCLVETASA
jgi:hypothetical protein